MKEQTGRPRGRVRTGNGVRVLASAINFQHELFDLSRVLRVRIVRVEFFVHSLAPVIAALRKLPRNEVDPARYRLESGSCEIPSPVIVSEMMQAARAFPDRERRQESVIDFVPVCRAQVFRNVKRAGAVIRLEKCFQFCHSHIRRGWFHIHDGGTFQVGSALWVQAQTDQNGCV